ncbi:unnamed protein product [Microthlaspi erraticum]|uniref:Uncharacterized protein n=1 Tax=Microthlaspi erraticum TaxID=1685480 RepID=A0A6D2L567_9BRAS|nr:unnamed protein product [Microthlaspi erraticum]
MEDRSMDLYPPPIPNLSNCVTIKLTLENYTIWRDQFEAFLWGQRLLGFITGGIPPPLPTLTVTDLTGATSQARNPAYTTWCQTDQVVRSWLLRSFSDTILRLVHRCTSSYDVWMALSNHFNKVSSNRLFELHGRLQNITKAGKTMTAYLQEIKDLCDQLDAIGNPVSTKMHVYHALHGLGHEYEPVKTTIEASMEASPCPSLDDVTPRLTAFDARLQTHFTSTGIKPHLAFHAMQISQGYYSNRGRGQSQYRGGRGRSFSTRGRGFPQQVASIRGPTTQSDTENKKLCQICGKKGHVALSCWHRFYNAYQEEEMPMAMAAMCITNITDQTGHEWFPDTGASAHVTNSCGNL